MRIIVKIIDSMNDWIGRAASLLMIPLVLISAYEVMMRYVFSRPTIWAWDLNIQIFAAIIMLGGGYTFLKNGHVRVDVLTSQLSDKQKQIIDLMTPLFLFAGTLVLMIQGWDMAWMSFKIRETVATVWAPPYYYMKMLVPVGAFLLFLQGVSELIKSIIVFTGKKAGE
ncbi:MAG: TRAP transporter small permease subunit [Deltaproteobacteria bacterium]|nr:TRAP transporter small permease subunit [Deltaproteobacteria bacterium]